MKFICKKITYKFKYSENILNYSLKVTNPPKNIIEQRRATTDRRVTARNQSLEVGNFK